MVKRSSTGDSKSGQPARHDEGWAAPAPPGSEDAPVPRSARRTALDTAFRDVADLRVGLSENLALARTRRATVDERVQHAFQEFEATSAAARARRQASGETAGAAVERAVRAGLAGRASDTVGPGLTVRHDSGLIRWNDDTPKTGAVDLGDLAARLNASTTSALTLTAPVNARSCSVQQEAQAIIDAIDGVAAGDEDAPGDDAGSTGTPAGALPAPTAEEVGTFVSRAVRTQMASASAPEERLQYGLLPTGAGAQAGQAHLLDTFQLRPGPTDVTAYHDFSVLNIAFEDTWTRIFDGELEALGRDLYREYVGLTDFLGYDPATADRPISSLDDLAWLIAEIRALSQLTQNSLPPGGARPGVDDVKGPNEIADAAEQFVENLPGGRPLTALGTLGLSELVLWLIRDAASWGRKEALRWDDLLNDRPLSRGDRIEATIDERVTDPGNVELRLWTDISRKKDLAFQVFVPGHQKPENRVRVSNFSSRTETRVHSGTGQPAWYVHTELIPTADLASGLLEFSSQEGDTQILLGRYVIGDLDQVVADGGRLSFYWKDA